jgi:hypothetical protein
LTLNFENMKINKIQQNKHNNWPQNLQMNMNFEKQVWKLTFSANAT